MLTTARLAPRLQPRAAGPGLARITIPPSPPSSSKTLLGRPRSLAELIEPAARRARLRSAERLQDAVSQEQELVDALRDLSTDDRTSWVWLEAPELLREARRRVCDTGRARGIDVLFYCMCNRVRVHARAFTQALCELLDNAIRASRPGRPVIVDVRETSEGDALWQIQDRGDGMPVPVLRDLGVVHEGAGLGVPLAWAVVEKHDGMLHLESTAGVGTTASIWLPRG